MKRRGVGGGDAGETVREDVGKTDRIEPEVTTSAWSAASPSSATAKPGALGSGSPCAEPRSGLGGVGLGRKWRLGLAVSHRWLRSEP